MKITNLLYLCFFVPNLVVAQNDTISKPSPLSFGASYIGEGVNNLSGGLKTGFCYLGAANFRILFDTEKANFWRGGEFFINGANTHGGTPSASLLGDAQGFTNIEAGNLTYMHELWYKQTLGKFATVVGLQDLNSEFISSESAGLFLNGSFGTHSTIADNIHAPIFPLTALGLQLQYAFSDKVTAKIGFFDGFLEDFDTNPNNLKWHLRSKEGVSTFTEVSFPQSFISNTTGMYRVGVYTHNHLSSSISFADSTLVGNVYGFYFMGDQTILETVGGGKLSVFTQLSYSPSRAVKNNYYVGLGVNYLGVFKKRPNDVVGVAMARAGFQNYLVSHETSLELTYKAIVCENIFLQPDFQYVIHPSGTDSALSNASLITLRFGLNF